MNTPSKHRRFSSSAQSYRVGEAEIHPVAHSPHLAAITNVYQALVPLACGICSAPILPSECFTRKALGANRAYRGGSVQPVCAACQPWRMI